MTDSDHTDPNQGAAESALLRDTRLFIGELELRKKRWASVVQRGRKIYLGEEAAAQLFEWLEAIIDVTSREEELEGHRTRLSREWEQKAHENFLKLETHLRNASEARGWRVEGQWPDLYVERGIRLVFNEANRSAVVGNVSVKHSSLSAILDELERSVKDLIPRSATPENFIAQLSDAYDFTGRGKDGQRAILDVYVAFVIVSQSARFRRDARADYFQPITIDQFRARLSWALQAGITADANGRELRLYPPLDVKDALFLYIPAEERFGYVGRIQFLRVGDSEA